MKYLFSLIWKSVISAIFFWLTLIIIVYATTFPNKVTDWDRLKATTINNIIDNLFWKKNTTWGINYEWDIEIGWSLKVNWNIDNIWYVIDSWRNSNWVWIKFNNWILHQYWRWNKSSWKNCDIFDYPFEFKEIDISICNHDTSAYNTSAVWSNYSLQQGRCCMDSTNSRWYSWIAYGTWK